MSRNNGIRPAPVYVATFADGTVGRCSFWSQGGKPIDVAAGRRTAVALWARPEKGERCSDTARAKHLAAIERLNKAHLAGLNSNSILRDQYEASLATMEAANLDVAASFFHTYAPAVIVAGHVEHPALAAPIVDSLSDAPVRKRPNWAAIAAAARNALERGDHAEALRLLAA